MAGQLQTKNTGFEKAIIFSIEFIVICAIAFIVGILTTVYFISSMSGEMQMPGGWKMSMMWMRMPGQTWLLSVLSFLAMWLAMMVAMMMPSAWVTFLKTGRQWLSLCAAAAGYFSVWLIAGVIIYVVGMAFNDAAMRYQSLSRAVPLISGILLIAAGIFQFTDLKRRYLLCCRSSFGCAGGSSQNESAFRLGCKQGLTCCICCSGLMLTQLILGIMNPLAMVLIAAAIAAEKLFPLPEVTVRIIGFIISIVGIIIPIR